MALKETIPFSFNDIKEYIKTKFVGYDLEEGSNTMQLVNAMSYLVSMLNANTAANINETILTLARKRKMILQDARVLGYEPKHITSYQYTLDIAFPGLSGYSGTSGYSGYSGVSGYSGYPNNTIDKYTEFTSGSYTYYYLGDTIDAETLAMNNGEATINVIEGTLHKTADEYDTLHIQTTSIEDPNSPGVMIDQNYVDIPFTNVEDTYGIEAFLTYYTETGTRITDEPWTRTEQFMPDADIILNKQYVRLDNIEYGTPRIYFKFGTLDKGLRVGTLIDLNILTSSGSLGVGSEVNTDWSCSLDGTITSATLVITGADEETNANIKWNAPLFNNSAGRAVTKEDYMSIVNRQSTIKYSEVWDGNKEFPHTPGHIWFSFVPASLTALRSIITSNNITWSTQNTTGANLANYFVEDDEIENGNTGVFDVLQDYTIPTLVFHHRHPVYMDFDYAVKISKYIIKTSKETINKKVFDIIDNYFNNESSEAAALAGTTYDTAAAETFWFEYFQSNLIKRIDTELSDITGIDLTLTTSITLLPKHIIFRKAGIEVQPTVESAIASECRFYLGYPYSNIFTGELPDATKLPELLYSGTALAYGSGTDTPEDNYITFPIAPNAAMKNDVITHDNSTSIGSCIVHYGTNKYIEVVLNLETSTAPIDKINSGSITSSGFKITVNYPTPNIPFILNTIPRLKYLTFV